MVDLCLEDEEGNGGRRWMGNRSEGGIRGKKCRALFGGLFFTATNVNFQSMKTVSVNL